ncbi:hypothetical protein [Sulfurimonas microaerophilic]|uniref:hypothetical protein n=1 Tax=Sulfurimonas microaerophilic TaxID=3058392 RepID=UPI002714AD8E|nr:hypothetical protein [Sulfurimonas sp. hsl 1-7]
MNKNSFLKIFTAYKGFDAYWIGHPLLNKIGLHIFRIKLADLFYTTRKMFFFNFKNKHQLKTLFKDGVLTVPNFISNETFSLISKEVQNRIKELEQQQPIQLGDIPGFQQPTPFKGGFDRYDGGTLNRFIDINKIDTPHLYDYIYNNPELKNICQKSSSYYYKPHKFKIYQMVHGDSETIHDLQKEIHKDTFHSTIKLWIILEDVKDEEGLKYSIGSHKINLKRLKWEYAKSITISQPNHSIKGGAFRLSKEELLDMGFSDTTSFAPKANTLVIADTRGFHCRGEAKTGAQRIAIYASLRPAPFSPLPY